MNQLNHRSSFSLSVVAFSRSIIHVFGSMNLSALSLLVLYSDISVYHSSILRIIRTGDDIFSIAEPSAMSYMYGSLFVPSICLFSCCIATIAMFLVVAICFSFAIIVLIWSGLEVPGASIIQSQSTNTTSHPLSAISWMVSESVSML